MAGKAPPHGDVGTTSGTARATKGHESAFRGRLARTGIYKGAAADTGSSSKMPTGKATAPLVLGRGAKR